HFNDFIQVTQLRGALYRALEKESGGLTDEIVAQRVTEELGLTMADFARNPGAKYSQKDEAWRALREVTSDAEAWEGCHFALRDDDPIHRQEIATALLDELRRNLAIDVEYLSSEG